MYIVNTCNQTLASTLIMYSYMEYRNLQMNRYTNNTNMYPTLPKHHNTFLHSYGQCMSRNDSHKCHGCYTKCPSIVSKRYVQFRCDVCTKINVYTCMYYPTKYFCLGEIEAWCLLPEDPCRLLQVAHTDTCLRLQAHHDICFQ